MRYLATGILAAAITAALMAFHADGHWQPGMHNQQHAIVSAFCGKRALVYRPCRAGREALVVARLESGAFHWFGGHCRRAENGQYRGCFQMGSWERRTYGYGPDPWSQARGAFRYWLASGRDWSPWSCKPWGWCLR